MDSINQYLSAGQLQQAIETTQQALRQRPGAHDLRACLVELLCLAGELVRADDMLATLARHNPEWLAGTVNLQQLLRAQQARLALRQGRLADNVVAVPGESLEALLALNLHLFQGQSAEARIAATSLEASRTPCCFQVGQARGDLRDCDDSLNGYLEGLGTDGCYYLWRWSEIQSLRLHAPTSPIELVWRRAVLDLADGRQGEAFLPLTYAASRSDGQLLGRETAWHEHGPGLVSGLGQKLLLLGDAAFTLEQLQDIQRIAEVVAETSAGTSAETGASHAQ